MNPRSHRPLISSPQFYLPDLALLLRVWVIIVVGFVSNDNLITDVTLIYFPLFIPPITQGLYTLERKTTST